jgi:hypothetical protein
MMRLDLRKVSMLLGVVISSRCDLGKKAEVHPRLLFSTLHTETTEELSLSQLILSSIGDTWYSFGSQGETSLARAPIL